METVVFHGAELKSKKLHFFFFDNVHYISIIGAVGQALNYVLMANQQTNARSFQCSNKIYNTNGFIKMLA